MKRITRTFKGDGYHAKIEARVYATDAAFRKALNLGYFQTCEVVVKANHECVIYLPPGWTLDDVAWACCHIAARICKIDYLSQTALCGKATEALFDALTKLRNGKEPVA